MRYIPWIIGGVLIGCLMMLLLPMWLQIPIFITGGVYVYLFFPRKTQDGLDNGDQIE